MKAVSSVQYYLLVLFNSAVTVNLQSVYDKPSMYDYAKSEQCKRFCGETDGIQKRETKPPRSRILEMMLQTPTFALKRNEPDIFSIFRDQYELPKGELLLLTLTLLRPSCFNSSLIFFRLCYIYISQLYARCIL